MYSWNASEDVAALAHQEAVIAGNNARIMLELEDAGIDVERESIRRRLARTLVQLGIKLDPLAGEDASQGD